MKIQMKPLYVLEISKREVETADVSRLRAFLHQLYVNGDAKKSFQSVVIVFAGYDDDEREVYEVEEIRSYVNQLIKEPGTVFYYTQNYKLLLSCIANVKAWKPIQAKNGDQYPMLLEFEADFIEQLAFDIKMYGILANNIEQAVPFADSLLRTFT